MNDATASRIIQNYQAYDESGRLKTPYGVLEELHTRELILRHLTLGKGHRILDIGGGTGPYSFWLASLGFEVHLSDIVPLHVEAARSQQTDHPLASIQIEDARSLSYGDNTADVVLLNGPLYHLVSRLDRELVLRECHRVLKPGGVLLAFAITRLSGLLYSLRSGAVFSEDYFSMVKHELSSGVRTNPEGKNQTFLEAFFHRSDDLRNEVAGAGFQVEGLLGVLGQAWNVENLGAALGEATKRARLLEVARLMEEMPDLGPKMLALGRKESRHV